MNSRARLPGFRSGLCHLRAIILVEITDLLCGLVSLNIKQDSISTYFIRWEGFPGSSAGKESACNVGDLCWIPELGRSRGEGNSYPLQYSGLENSMDCIVQGVTKCQTRLSDFHFHQYIICRYSLPFDSFPFGWWFSLLFRSFLVVFLVCFCFCYVCFWCQTQKSLPWTY